MNIFNVFTNICNKQAHEYCSLCKVNLFLFTYQKKKELPAYQHWITEAQYLFINNLNKSPKSQTEIFY